MKKDRSMHSEAYWEARSEFINCLAMSIVGVGVPLVLAFKTWKPIMNEELRKEKQLASPQAQAAGV